jgi:hypothetical protein
VVRALAVMLSAWLFYGVSACHAEEVIPAVYQRTSTHAMLQQTNWSHHGAGWGVGGFYNPWFSPFTFAGTWYQRPYPDHLVFNNVRSHAVPLVPMTTECPCLETTE